MFENNGRQLAKQGAAQTGNRADQRKQSFTTSSFASNQRTDRSRNPFRQCQSESRGRKRKQNGGGDVSSSQSNTNSSRQYGRNCKQRLQRYNFAQEVERKKFL